MLAWFSHHIARESTDLDIINSFCTQLLRIGTLEQITYNNVLRSRNTDCGKLEFKVSTTFLASLKAGDMPKLQHDYESYRVWDFGRAKIGVGFFIFGEFRLAYYTDMT